MELGQPVSATSEIQWRSTAGCDPSTRAGRVRIRRSNVHLDRGDGVAVCGVALAATMFQKPALARHCVNCIRFRRLTPALCVILAALADDRVVIDGQTITYRTAGDELATERLPAFYKHLLPASRKEWLALKFKPQTKSLTIQ